MTGSDKEMSLDVEQTIKKETEKVLDDVNSNSLLNPVSESIRNIVIQLTTNFVDKLGEHLVLPALKKRSLKRKIEELVHDEIKADLQLNNSDERVLNEVKDEVHLNDIDDAKYSSISRLLKPAEYGFVRQVIVRSSNIRSVVCLFYLTPVAEGRRGRLGTVDQALKFLEENSCRGLLLDHFCFEKTVLGFKDFEFVQKDTEFFVKPMRFGWLRNVTVRPSDQRVTSIGYVTPPDSEGRRQRLSYKKDIQLYLEKMDIKDLGVEDFSTTRKVIGLPQDFEIIKAYHPRISFTDLIQKCREVKSKPLNGVTIDPDPNSSYTVVDNSSSSSSDESSSTDSTEDISGDSSNTSFDNPSEIKVSCTETLSIISNPAFSSKQLAIMAGSETTNTHQTISCYSPSLSSVQSCLEVNPSSLGLSSPTSTDDLATTDISFTTTPNQDHDLSSNTSTIPVTAKAAEVVQSLSVYSPTATSTSGARSPEPTVACSSLHSTVCESYTQPDDSSRLNLMPWSSVSPSPQFSANRSPIPPRASSGVITQPGVNVGTIAMATVLMVSTESGKERRKQLRMSIKSGVKIEKGMKKFGDYIGLDFRKLKFFSAEHQLSGEEAAGELDGAIVRVDPDRAY